MFTGIKLYALIAALLALAGLGLYVRHEIYSSGFDDGKAEIQPKLDTANKTIDALKTDKANLTAAVSEANAAASREKADAEKKVRDAALVMKQVMTDGLKAQTELSAWRAKFKNLTLTGDCATVAKAQVCPELADY